MATKKLLFITGTRADFGKLKPLILAVDQAPEFEYAIFATGMHMLSRYGSTVIEIEKAGFRNVHSFINQDGSVSSQMDIVLANTIQGLGHYLREYPVDLIVVHGDRVEALAGAVVGALRNILVAHVEGGEVSGTVDELIRHAVSKLSHLHFVSNDVAQRRLIQMGELPEAIFTIGSPEIDLMLSTDLPSLAEVKRKYDITFDEYGVVIYHPVTTELPLLASHIAAVVDSLRASNRNFVVIYPNNDAGAEIILAALQGLQSNSCFRLIPSMRFEYFLTLLKSSQVVVGNSSVGIREAPVYGVPTINIGTRQLNRFDYASIVNVVEDMRQIVEALANLPRSVPPSFHFGRGDSAKLFLEELRGSSLWLVQPQKQFRDVPAVAQLFSTPTVGADLP